jgi:hypothetical protein
MNNEPAFPALPISRELDGEFIYQAKGLTIRDYFAAKAMSYWLSIPIGKDSLNNVSVESYRVADAMLKARDGNS